MSFKKLDPEDVVIGIETGTTSAWTGNAPTLTTFFTSSAQPAAQYYINVFQTSSTAANSEVQFSIAYAHKKGSGSVALDSSVPNITPSTINFSTYRNLISGDEDTDIDFATPGATAVRPEYFYAINLDRSKYKEKLQPGSFILSISGSGGQVQLRDSSISESIVRYTDAGRVYNVVKTTGGYSASAGPNGSSGSWGLFLPDIGTILLNGPVLDISTAAGGGINLGTTTTAGEGNNAAKLFSAISRSASFQVRADETLPSNFVFVRARNTEFNYSTNPSYITGSGELRINEFIDSPRAYFTSVGLYNDNNDLLAVAKLSRPLLKDSTKEALVRIKLDY